MMLALPLSRLSMPDCNVTLHREFWQPVTMSPARKYSDPGLKKAIDAMGSASALARALGISHVAVLRWKRVPYKHIIRIEKITGVAREDLRPELYRKTHR